MSEPCHSAEPELRRAPFRSDELLDAVLRALPSAVLVLDREGECVDVVEGGTGGAPPPEVGAAPVRDVLARTLETGESQLFEYQAEGSRSGAWFAASTAPLRGSDPESDLVAWVARDISEEKRLEGRLGRATAELQHFAYAASHDLQEPLRMVLGFTDLLNGRLQGELDEKSEEFMQQVVEGAHRMKQLLDGLLAYSRVTTQGEELRPVSSRGALERALANLRREVDESGTEVTIGELPEVLADGEQLTQLFHGLLDNSIKFRRNGSNAVRVSARERAGSWRFCVEDSGLGIAAKDAERVFKIFQRLHGRSEYSGVGLGLALCQRIVQRHGGEIWVESEPAVGSRFFFTLSGIGEQAR